MTITRRDPNTIYLGGGSGPGGENGMTLVNDRVAYSAITPGMLLEVYNDGGTPKYRPHSTANGTFAAKIFGIEQIEWNQGVNDAYAAGDLVKAGIMRSGCVVWGIIPSGQTVAPGDPLSSNGDGKFRNSATAPVCRAAEGTGGVAVTVDTRLRMEVL